MVGFSRTSWAIVAILLVLHVAICAKVARHAGRLGRNPVRWFVIAFFFSAAGVGMLLKSRNPSLPRSSDDAAPGAGDGAAQPTGDEGQVLHCPHCGLLIQAERASRRNVARTCPKCRMVIDEAYLA